MPLLFAMGGPLVSVLVIASLFRNGASATGIPFLLAFPLCVSYALLGFMQMIYNNLGAEGTGIQMLFLSPTPIRKVLLAKNLFHGMLFLLVAVLAGVFTALRMGTPSGLLLATTAAWLVFALPAKSSGGEYPVAHDALSREPGKSFKAARIASERIVELADSSGYFGCRRRRCAVMRAFWKDLALCSRLFSFSGGHDAGVAAGLQVRNHQEGKLDRRRSGKLNSPVVGRVDRGVMLEVSNERILENFAQVFHFSLDAARGAWYSLPQRFCFTFSRTKQSPPL